MQRPIARMAMTPAAGVGTGTRRGVAVRTEINLLMVVAVQVRLGIAGTETRPSQGPVQMETGRVRAARMVLNSNNYPILCRPVHDIL